MSSKMPPVPPANLSPKGPATDGTRLDVSADPAPGAPVRGEPGRVAGQKANPDKIGQAANTKINTTHQGDQQDR